MSITHSVGTILNRVKKYACSSLETKCYIKRATDDGSFEAQWIDITEDVLRWPNIKHSSGDLTYYGEFSVHKSYITLYNGHRKYSLENEPKSYFYRKSSVNIQFKLETRAKATIRDPSESPFNDHRIDRKYFVCFQPPKVNENQVTFSINDKLFLFKQVSMHGDNFGGTSIQTALQAIFEKTDTTGSDIFQRYFTVDTGTIKYYDLTGSVATDRAGISTIKDIEITNKTAFAVIADLCQLYGAYPYITRNNAFEIRKKRRSYTETLSSVNTGTTHTSSTHTYASVFTFTRNNVSAIRIEDGEKNIINATELTYGTEFKRSTRTSAVSKDLSYKPLRKTYEMLDKPEEFAEKMLNTYSNKKRRVYVTSLPLFIEPGNTVVVDFRADPKGDTTPISSHVIASTEIADTEAGINEKLTCVVLECEYTPPFCENHYILEEV